MKFQFNTCPLCDEVCQLHKVAGVTVFRCPTESLDIPEEKSHYEVELDNKTEVQRIIVYPFAIDSFLNSFKSRVYHATIKDNQTAWKLVMEVPLIRAESEARLLERINTLVTFL